MRTLFTLLFALTLTHSAHALNSVRVVSGLSRPVAVTFAPGDPDRLFVAEQHTGAIKIINRHTKTVDATPFITVTGLTTGNEQGLLGLAFHPNYQTNGYFYVNITTTGGGAAGKTQILRYTRSSNANVADPASKTLIIEYDQPETNHNGGWVGFGADGFLYIGAGDGGSGDDPHGTIGNGQDRNALLGKILRIDVNGGSPYAIPDGNPFKGDTSKKQEIWAFGLRNPYRCSFDRTTGDLWIGDVGQGSREEIDFMAAGVGGANFGWRPREGLIQNPTFPGETPVTTATDPVHDYSHSLGLAVIGGYRYRGTAIPTLQGVYIFADYQTNRIWTGDFNGTTLTNVTERQTELAPGGGQTIDSISSFGEDILGEIYICDLGGEIFKIIPNTAANAAPTAVLAHPASLTGSAGVALNFSATGSADADGSVVLYAWDFGDGTPLVVTTQPAASHTYATDGTFTVTLNVYDDRGDKSATAATLSAIIGTGIGGGTPGDADGDGFSDELELGVGTSPSNASDTPFGGAPAGATQPLTLTKLQIKLNFAKESSDSIQVAGTLPVPAGFSVASEVVVLNTGGVVKSFTLGEKGKSPRANDTFAIKIKARKGVVEAQDSKFQAKMMKGDFDATLSDEGLTSADVKAETRNVLVTLLFNNTKFQTTQPQQYSAKTGKSGRTTIPK